MELEVTTISRICWDIIDKNKIFIENIAIPEFQELLNKIHELYPTLEESDYTLYWRYSKEAFVQIQDFLSYATALNLMSNPTVYLMLDDCGEYWDEIRRFLRELDKLEQREEAERKRDKYDVRIPGRDEDNEESESEEDEETERESDCGILAYALRKQPEVGCFTADLLQKTNLITDVKKGIYILLTQVNKNSGLRFYLKN